MPAFFDAISSMLGAKKAPTADQLAELATAAGKHLAATETRLAELEAGRAEAVVSGGEKGRVELRVAMREALADVEEAKMAVAEIERRLADRRAAEAEEVKRANYDAALRLRTAAGKRLQAQYETVARTIVELIADVARADAACEAANKKLPAGADPLDTTERVTRMGGGAPERLLSSKEVRLWARPGASEPLSEEMQAQVRVDPQSATGGYLRSGGPIGPVMPVELRTFRRIEVLEAVPGTLPPALASISLPALRGGDPDIWIASKFWTPPAAIVAAAESSAEASRRKANAPERRKIVRFEMLADRTLRSEGPVTSEATE